MQGRSFPADFQKFGFVVGLGSRASGEGAIPFAIPARLLRAINALEGQRFGRDESDSDCGSAPGSPCK